MLVDPKFQKSLNDSETRNPTSVSKQRKPNGKVDFEALLPHDRLAEQAVLGAVILNNQAFQKTVEITTSN